MIFGKMRLAKGILVLFVVGAISVFNLQSQEISKFDLEERAKHHFDNKRFDKASADYEVLYGMYPKDAGYTYFLGRSYLESNQQLDKAVELLKFSATRNYGDDTYLYLGIAYHHIYRFEDAMLAFITFQKTANARILKASNLDYWLAVATQAKQEVQVANNITVLEKSEVELNKLETAYSNLEEGKFIYVPNEFCSETDEELNYRSVMFLPNEIAINDYVYFSSYFKNDKCGLQLCRAQRINENEYSLPEPLPASINTEYNEAYPYYSKETNTLYFSSDRKNTMGGYDIYSTHYIHKNNQWSSPDKQAFPINSVHDDILYVAESNQQARIVSNRNTIMNNFEAFILQAETPAEYITPENIEEVIALSELSVSSILPSNTTEVLLADETVVERSEQVSTRENEIIPAKTEYELKVNEAMELQTQSDSLASIVKKLRLKARDEHNYQKKNKLIAGITSLEKEGKRLQQMADMKFTEAELIRTSKTELLVTEVEEPAKITNSNNGITRIANNTMITTTKKTSKQQKEQEFEAGYQAAKITGELVESEFTIAQSSPYSKSNPIPEAKNPSSLVYRIQLGAYTNEIPANTFGGLRPVAKSNKETGTKYYVGFFTNSKEARQALDKVKEYGYPDAFLVSFYNDDRISVQQAREIEFSRQ